MINGIAKNRHYFLEILQSIVLSILFHLTIFVIFVILNSESITFHIFKFAFFEEQKKIKILESAVRVDIVAMPKLTVKDMKSFKIIPLGNYKEIKLPEKKLKKMVTKDISSLLKKMSKENTDIDMNAYLKKSKKGKKIKKRNAANKRSVPAGLSRKEIKNLIIAGNKLSSGSSLTGKFDIQFDDDFNKYARSLPDWVRPNWLLPSFLSKGKLQCRIQIFLNREGDILRTEIFSYNHTRVEIPILFHLLLPF